jgi:hypothetical protein
MQIDDFVHVVLHIQVANQVQLHLMSMFDIIIIIIKFLHQHLEEQIKIFNIFTILFQLVFLNKFLLRISTMMMMMMMMMVIIRI